MNLRLTFFLFISPAFFTAVAGEYHSFPPRNKITEPRIRGSRRLVEPTASFLLELPRRPLELPDTAEVNPPGRIDVVHMASEKRVSLPVDLQLNADHRPRRASYPDLDIPLNSLPAGSYRAEWFPPGIQDTPAATWDFHSVAAAFEKVPEDHQAEIASWIEEANRPHLIWGKLPQWPNLDRALAQPEDPYAGLTGFLIRSYPSPHLRRRQPYTVYVPESLDLSQPAPLMILLHGSGGDYRNLVADAAAGQEFEKTPMLIANAGAYRNTEFRHLPMEDVRAILEDMKSKYNVDPDRIYAQGISLGGRGVLDLAARMPDTFAAVSSQGAYGVHHDLLDPFYPVHTDPVAYRLAAKNDIRTWLPNLLNTPVEMVFGWQDTSTRPVGALVIAIRLQRLRATVKERGFDQGHNLTLPEYDWETTRKWFLTHTKEKTPRRILFRVDNLRHNRHAWIRVDALHDYSGVGEVEATMMANNTLRLETSNIAQLTFLPPGQDPDKAVKFPEDIKTYYFSEENTLIDAPQETNDQQVKNPGQSGPLWNVFSEPLIIAVDDSIDPAETETLIQASRSLERTDATPPFRFPVKRTSEITDKERASHNFIFVTTPVSRHPWNDSWGSLLPPEAEKLRQDPGTLFALRPSPWSDHHVVVVAQTTERRIPSLYNMGLFQEPLQADWLLTRGRRMTAAGVYKHNWFPGAWTSDPFYTRVITR